MLIMCKECEVKGVRMPLNPLLKAEIAKAELPAIWQKLAPDFHPDIYLRAKAGMAPCAVGVLQAHRHGLGA